MIRSTTGTVGEVAAYFLRLGVISFGGPAAHIAIMRRELAGKRAWTTDQELVDMLGVTNLIPGPNSTELAMHLGAKRAGWRGLWVGGLAFILPATLITVALAWAYVEYGSTPGGEGIILGIQPFMLAIICQAIWGLKGAALKGVETFILVFVVAFASALGASEVLLIFASGFGILAIHLAVYALTRSSRESLGSLPDVRSRWKNRKGPFRRDFAIAPLLAGVTSPPGYSHLELFLAFLKIGSVLYGSGYVLLAFMETEFVVNRGWLTEQQLVDAISAGQFTPGPVFSTAAFAGYVIGGFPGAFLGAAGIFLPSFVFVTLTHPFVARLRTWRWTAPFLDGVNAAALALMVVVTINLGLEVLDHWYAAALFVVAVGVLLRFNPNTAWFVIAGVAAGLLWAVVR